ncbi:MAG: hypothetical protein BRC29_05345 [Nanohaloarchaea archaeon SW_7_43_1]|nr:MAG: hypothetical protein BRC29_05345 [Nanohaloarchaea archaeon SW_7_43_1]
MRAEIIFMAVIVAASGCLHAAEPASEQNTDTTQPSEIEYSDTRTIYFTGSGFEPADLTIRQGETVTWISNASASMWVGSNEHPTHTNYDDSTRREHCENGDPMVQAFDQCSTGDRYSFTFEKTGEWGYHNHQPYVGGGTITVVEK